MQKYHIEIDTDKDFALPKLKEHYRAERYSFNYEALSLFVALSNILEGIHFKEGYELPVIDFFAKVSENLSYEDTPDEGAVCYGNYSFEWTKIGK